ncbi:hypothetical protein BDE36_0089 [Arcticibacter tournemirensis]|uniref:Beta-lactamase-inhibitor-like PepSY-like domain-containing protein n=1 Tax=Arcticibacter tournemirensis TaxID=699437 RepID=A0A4Q0M542_9SPHI|nr:hypothetical protein [Arcticibacter tournemirensis]KAA8477965.1 hypothetical protein F1649_18365 [Arcticibacter tournemirensis]RXF68044.1 hypothetical protein EKH83_17390 [Arcticibacter tournemirensis]TQM48412.1 hypothetical protein BDE36_0089 [Arcticibacter tournemirensis]
MKKLFYLAFLVLALSGKSYADDKNKSEKKDAEVSYFAENNFLSKYQSAANVKWTVTNQFQKASFTLDGVKMSAFFDLNGDYIATTQYVDFNKLPAVSKSRLQKFYADYSVDEIVRYDFDGQNDSGLYLLSGQRNYGTIYFASLKNKEESMVVKITPDGEVSYLKNL